MKKIIFLATILMGGMLTGCNNKQTTDNDMEQERTLTQEWDKVFPLSEKVNHKNMIPWDTLAEFFAKNLK